MANHQEVLGSRAYRLGYITCRSVQRAYNPLKRFEHKWAERVLVKHSFSGVRVIQVGLILIKLVLLSALVFISVWLFLLACILFAIAAMEGEEVEGTPDINDVSNPEHRTFWAELYDEWGSLK